MANRLAGSSSPYLLQHADNPVDWWEWGTRRSPRRGAATCRSCSRSATPPATGATSWRTSRSRTTSVAAVAQRRLRRGQGRPRGAARRRRRLHGRDQGAHRSGRLADDRVLTPDGEPFFAGTYLPKHAAARAAGQRSARSWARPQRERGARRGRARRASSCASAPGRRRPHAVDADVLRRAPRRRLRSTFDEARGGFGGAPKFPPSMVLEFLLRHHARTGSADALAMVARTCEAMARGGIYDQLGGRLRPLLRRRRLGRAALREDALRQRAAAAGLRALVARDRRRRWPSGWPRETADFLLRDLRTDEGGFASRARRRHATGVRGADLRVDPGAARRGARRRRRRAGGRPARASPRRAPSSTGSSTLQLPVDPDDPAWWAATREPAARRPAPTRPQPGRDDKVVAAWNGLAIAALAEAGALLARPDWSPRRERGRRFVLDAHRRRRPAAPHVARRGRSGTAPAVLEDYGDLAEGLLALHQATGAARWLRRRRDRCSTPRCGLRRRRRRASTTPPTTPRPLFARPRDPPTTPSRPGASALAGALLTLRGAHRVDAAPRRRRGGARRLRAAWRSSTRGSPGGPWRWPRPRSPARCRSRSSATGRTPGAAGGGPGQHLARSRRAVRGAGRPRAADAGGPAARRRAGQRLRVPRGRLRAADHDPGPAAGPLVAAGTGSAR